MVNKAGTDAQDSIDQAAGRAHEKTADMLEKARSEAQQEAEKIIENGMSDSRAIKDSAESRIAAATKIIINQVIGEA